MNPEQDAYLAANFPRVWNQLVDDWTASDGRENRFPRIATRRRTLLRQIRAVTFVGGIAVLTAPNQWSKDEIENELTRPLEDVLEKELQQKVTISLSVRESTQQAEDAHDVPAPAQESPAPNAAPPSQGSADPARPAPTPGHNRPLDQHEYSQPGVQTQMFSESEERAAAAFAEQYEHPQEQPQYPSPTPPNWQHLTTPAADTANQPPKDGPRPVNRQGSFGPSRGDATSATGGQENGAILNKKYTFETFVIGSSNQFAHAACRAVAEAPARSYNPLFIWGDSGLGKTHLLHAIGHYALELQPSMKVHYVSSEELTNDFINAIANDRRDQFKRRYRSLDMLIVDDIQFLQGKESTQEEFFHTFNALHQANKQIVLSSDRPPRQLTTLEDRLRTRFEGGLITDVQSPDLETRMAILSKKVQNEKLVMPEDVIEMIASRYEKSVRELDGAFNCVYAYCSLAGEPITIETAKIALRDILPSDEDVVITMQTILDVVTEYFSITVDEITGKARSKKYVHARQIAMHLGRELTDLSLPKLGAEFGGRDHTTVMYADRRIREALTENRKTFNEVQELTQRVKSHARN